MTVNNAPKFWLLIFSLACLTALMIAGRIDMASGVPILTMVVGYGIGNGVNAKNGEPPSNIFGTKKR